MRTWCVLAVVALCSAGAHAQWLNYPSPGVPRTKDGRVNLSAPAPRTREGKPDLSGVWHVEPSGLPEMKRIFGNDVDAVEVPGMTADTISKYGISVLIDFKPGEEPLRKDVAEEISRCASAEGAGLVVMGLRARGQPGVIASAVLKTHRAFVLAVPGC